MTAERDPHLSHAVLAGLVCSLVGFTSSFAVVIAGLRAVGASDAQAGSAIMAMSMVLGALGLWFSWRRRQPVILAWSTPGAAMLASAAIPAGGFPTAVGAFAVTGLLLALTGLFSPLARLMERVPAWLAQAMLAGVLLPLCTAPFVSAAHAPRTILPVLAAWLAVRVLAPRWAVPAAVLAAVVVIATTGALDGVGWSHLTPHPLVVTPHLDVASVIAISLPLYLVTMTSQNLPGLGVMRSFGYQLDARGPLVATGLGTSLVALLGGHAINLAAISAALAAGDESHPDRDRRWIAGIWCGIAYLLLGLGSGAVITVAAHAPHGLLETVGGLALLATFASAAHAALADPAHREAGALAILVGASGLTIAGIGDAFWALVAGGVFAVLVARGVSWRARRTGPTA